MQEGDDSSGAQRPSQCCETSDGIWLPRHTASRTGDGDGSARGITPWSYVPPDRQCEQARASMRRRRSISESDVGSVTVAHAMGSGVSAVVCSVASEAT
jgi:hypothetical protein